MNYFRKIIYYSRLILKKKIEERRKEAILDRYDKVYCILQRREEHYKEGLMACFLAIIKMIYEAEEMGCIPVVDMQTYKNPYLKMDEVGKKNAWEFFFEQPGHISLDEIQGKRNIIYLYEPPFNAFPSDAMDFLTSDGDVEFWRQFCKEKIFFSDKSKKWLKKYDSILADIKSKRTIGVYLRGTDYVSIQPNGHAIVPDVQESIEKVKNMMEKCDCQQIFLSVEDMDVQRKFESEFCEKVLYIDQKRYSKTGKQGLMVTKEFVNSDVCETGLTYLAAIYLITQCNCLVGARCCGSIGALLMAKDYEYTFFWNKGRYKHNHLNQPVKEY